MTRIAVLTLTRDRLDYTKHCFRRLDRLAGCDYHHFVLDQGSRDETRQWLGRATYISDVIRIPENIGISRGMNRLIDLAGSDYDLYVKFDNDCELTEPDTLKRVARASADDWILSPQVHGLNSPPAVGETIFENGERIGVVGQLGGIFMAIPGRVIRDGFRYDESNPKWGMDDVQLSGWFREQGGRLGYLLDVTCNHYETTKGQWARYPEYFRRKIEQDGLPGAIPC